MPGANSLSKGVRCPFWESADGLKIVCECSYAGSNPCMVFADRRICQRYKRDVCSGQFADCPLYQGLLATKYREEEGK